MMTPLARRVDRPGPLALNPEDDLARSAALVQAAGHQLGDQPGVVDDAVVTSLDRETIHVPTGPEESASLKLFLALPNYGYQRFNTIPIIHAVTEPGPFDAIFPEEHPGSLLAYGFNLLWVRALEERQHGCTHFLESTVRRKLSQPKPRRIRADRRRGWRALIQRDVAAARHTQRTRAVEGRP
jgi:hypothetical protein